MLGCLHFDRLSPLAFDLMPRVDVAMADAAFTTKANKVHMQAAAYFN